MLKKLVRNAEKIGKNAESTRLLQRIVGSLPQVTSAFLKEKFTSRGIAELPQVTSAEPNA